MWELKVLLLQNYDIEKLGYATNWNIASQIVCVTVIALTSQKSIKINLLAFQTVLDNDKLDQTWHCKCAADTLYTSGSSMVWFSFAAQHLATLQIHECIAGIAGIADGAAVLL